MSARTAARQARRRPLPDRQLSGWRRQLDSEKVRLPAIILAAIVIGIAIPLLASGNIFEATSALIYMLFALSVNVLFGWTGLPSFGQAAFFGIGAYAAALIGPSASPLLPLAAGALIATVASLGVALVLLRSTGMAFAMFTLAFAQILYEVAENNDSIGGDTGALLDSRGRIFGLNLLGDTSFWWYTLVIVVVFTLALRHLHGSSLGAAMRAVRQDPARAAALGISVRRIRTVAFAISAGVGAVAGGLFGQLNGIADPADDLFWTLSGSVLLMVILGGMYGFWGPAVGAVIYTIASTELLNYKINQNLAMGGGLLVVFLVFPGGVVGVFHATRRWLGHGWSVLRRGEAAGKESRSE